MRRKTHAAAHVSAEPSSPQAHPRVPVPDGVRQRTQGPGSPAQEGPGASGGLDSEEVEPAPRPGASFPKTCRIRTSAEYDRAFRSGRSIHTRHFRLVVAPAPEAVGRLGLVVSRKVGKAWARNRVKRRLREYFRMHRHAFAVHVDLVVVAKKGAAELETGVLFQELEEALAPWWGDSPSGR